MQDAHAESCWPRLHFATNLEGFFVAQSKLARAKRQPLAPSFLTEETIV